MNTQEQTLRTRLETGDFQRNFLVEAGAGAGKSHTICRRILRQILAGRDPGTIAAITFTEKATLELREKLDRYALDYDSARGTDLASLTAKLHVSTIHSFCQTALRLFPLETGGGLQVIPDEKARAADFFRAWTARDPGGAAAAFEAFGGGTGSLQRVFLDMAAKDHVPDTPSAADARARQLTLDALTAQAHGALQKHLLPHRSTFFALPEALSQAAQAQKLTPEQSAALRRVLREAWKQSTRPKRMAALFFTGAPFVKEKLDEYIEASKKVNQKADPARLGRVPPIFAAMAAFAAEMDKDGLAVRLTEAEKTAGYDLAVNVLSPALKAYFSERDRAGLVTFSGLLTQARDLVRDNPTARALLRRRYQVFYVDEFQDTDPVQAELLFLITDQDGTQRDWTRCRPAPGSLFLVGDPKQAIYRFRGADLDAYKRVKALFTDGPSPVGEVVSLRANFRSAPRICAFADRVFAPRDSRGNILSPEEQAENQANQTVTRFLDDGLYQANYVPMEAQQGDPGRETVFSYPTRISEGEADDADRVARFIQRAAAGGFTLPDRSGKPVPVRYGDFLLLTRKKAAAGRYLTALSALGIPVSFSGERPLAENPQIRRLERWLRWLMEPENEVALLRLLRGCFGITGFEAVRQLKQAVKCPLSHLVRGEAPRPAASPELQPLLDALADAGTVLEESRTLPPMAFLEKLAEERLFRSGDAPTPRERNRQYGDLRQLLGQLRQRPERGFPALARSALALCQGTLELELSLSPSADAVRVMNLHKAKGLEGRIVILVSDTAKPPQPRSAGGIHPILRFNSYGSYTLLYAPRDWEEQKYRELSHLEAEQVRLDYVAATRAEQLLLIAGGEVGKRGMSCWQTMADKAPPVTPNDPLWGDFFQPLLDPGGKALPVPAPAAGTAAVDLTARREDRIREQSVPGTLHTSPSTLDTSRYVPRTPDPEEAPEETVPPERVENAARGADWGTAIHRVMELCVSRKALDAAAARPFIAQALRESIPPLSRMTGTQRELLFGDQPPKCDEDGVRSLAERAERAVSFWFDAASPLRRLTAEGNGCCELPFRLLLSRQDEMWHFFQEKLGGGENFDGSISVSGILDLAVLTEEGWRIVDYKTDQLRPGEGKEDYRRRLVGEYEAQLTAYIRILSRLSGRKVLGAQLCAIPLGGELIDIG